MLECPARLGRRGEPRCTGGKQDISAVGWRHCHNCCTRLSVPNFSQRMPEVRNQVENNSQAVSQLLPAGTSSALLSAAAFNLRLIISKAVIVRAAAGVVRTRFAEQPR